MPFTQIKLITKVMQRNIRFCAHIIMSNWHDKFQIEKSSLLIFGAFIYIRIDEGVNLNYNHNLPYIFLVERLN